MSTSVFLMLAAIVMSLGILPTPVVMQTQPLLPGLSPQIPPFPSQDVKQCWSSIPSINGCLTDIYGSFVTGRVGSLGPLCCQAISSISNSCWPEMFPYSPSFPPLLKSYCAVSGVKNTKTDRAAVTPPTPASRPSVYEFSQSSPWGTLNPFNPTAAVKCLLSLKKTEGCYHEVITSIFSSQVGLVGPRCCQAISVIDKNCWPQICPLNPFFPPLIKSYCENLLHKTPRTPSQSPWN